ncbi:MAG: site-specific DNA-methyltransferase [Treponema sp.]|nr:MAG: site-specific DNA-methyltransferase [Treponema sp.]
MKINDNIEIKKGDCTKLLEGLEDNSVNAIVTDPPYLIKYSSRYRKNKNNKFCKQIKNDDINKIENKQLIKKSLKEMFRVLKNNSAMYLFCDFKNIDFFKKEILSAGFKIKNFIIWVKNNRTAGDLTASFGHQYEILILCNKGRKEINGTRLSDVWSFKRVPSCNLVHQNQKPIDLLERCLEKHTNKNDLILDPFMGSASTGLACLNTGRKFIGFEIDDEYFNISKTRLKEAVKDKQEELFDIGA